MSSEAADATREPPIRFPATGRVLELDGVRGLAILMVLLFHAALYYKPAPGTTPAYITRVLGFGWSGVDLFFVLSGFLIGGILLDQRASPTYFRTFYVRRICRIFPIYYLLILCYVIPTWLGVESSLEALYKQDDRLPLWQYWLYLQNIGMAMNNAMDSTFVLVTWSLAIEEQFYLLLPLLVRWTPVRALPWLFGAFVLSSPLLRLALFEPLPGDAYRTYLLLPCRWDALFLGALCAWAVRTPRLANLLASRPRLLYAALLFSGGAVATLVAMGPNSLTAHMAVPGFTIIAIFYAVLLLTVLHVPTPWVRRMARARWLRFLGDVSYPAYLLHFPVLTLAHWWAFGAHTPRGLSPVGVSAAAIGLTLVLAWISTNTFERYFIRIGRRATYEPSTDTD